jgi:hypothetical protein
MKKEFDIEGGKVITDEEAKENCYFLTEMDKEIRI